MYRRILRAARVAFAGDVPMQRGSARAAREAFMTPLTTEAELAGRLKEASLAVEFLEKNVVQAKLTQRGNYQIDAVLADEGKS